MFSCASFKMPKLFQRKQTHTNAPTSDVAVAPSSILKVSESRQYPKLKLSTELFALIIGINEYIHYKPHLSGAVKDANDIEHFLIDSMSVPPNHIKKLLNGDATKDRIIEEIQSLYTHRDIDKDRGDAILIYYAGHGARGAAPDGWSTPDGQIEMICPVDMSPSDAAEPRITGIPDIVLNELISQLAVQKGNNITVIFDCCHSSNGLRDIHVQPNVRVINKPPPLSGNWDNGIMQGRGKAARGEDPKQSLDCSVLLAACGREEKAGETLLGGLFTQCFLQQIEGLENIDMVQLSYNGLMRLLEFSPKQHPQCEGSKSNRYLFRKDTEDRSYIFGYKEDDKFVLEAGELQGIKPGAEFDIFGTNALSPDNRCRFRFQVDKVNGKTSYLSSITTPTSSDVPNQFYALQTSFTEEQKITVYCSDSDCTKLREVFLQHQSEFSGYATLVGTPDVATVLVSFEGDSMCFDWHEKNVITTHAGSRIGSPVPIKNKEDNETIRRVFQAVAKFNHYLHIEGADSRHIQLELHHMAIERQVIDGKPRAVRTPVGENLLNPEPAEIEIEEGKVLGPLVLTISNSSEKDLYLHVFWFDGRTLTIDPWYIGQRGAGLKEATASVDAPLRAGQKFPVGYGEVPVQPWEFLLEDGKPDIGFFKVFLATFNANVSSLAQASPFDTESDKERHGRRVKLAPVDWWATKMATVKQSVKGSSSAFDVKSKIGA
ncbi:hypothetical protein PILCRDRAFT_583059 [Piloderma croceum F 1598]|uniref:Peptidase C14 caspase domain-containing protein n=1 Tax=Piloderma croceum (strain F 1598) TaxID=765440 RepID=A0A0C3AXI7_PILCF|nr:hypothetical protein PILCRDRAFT_583059 [Piloderma croceum F 1598]